RPGIRRKIGRGSSQGAASGGLVGFSLSSKQPAKAGPHPLPETGPRNVALRLDGLLTLRVQLPGLRVRMGSKALQAQCLLAATQFQPEQKVAGVPFERLLKKLEGQRKLFVVTANPGRQPANKPILRRQVQSLLEAILGPRFLPGQ